MRLARICRIRLLRLCLFDKHTWVWPVLTGFLTISGWVSGFALSNGLSQQEHKLLEQKNEAQDEKIRRLEGTIFGI